MCLQLGVMVFKRSVLESRTKNKSILRTKSKPTVKDSIQVYNLCVCVCVCLCVCMSVCVVCLIQECTCMANVFRALLGRGHRLRSCLVKCSSGEQHSF